MPTLHHILGSWWVGEYPLRLMKERDHWRVLSQPSEIKATIWLKESGLADQRFRTRRDAFESLMLALEMEGSPKPSGKPTCTRLGPGHYRLAGGLVARRREPRKWDVLKLEGAGSKQWERPVGSAQSLWRAAWLAQARFDDREPRPFPQVRGH